MVNTIVNLTTQFTKGRYGSEINLIGIHTMEAPETSQTAEAVANYFKTIKASSHWTVDDDSRDRVVNDEDMAWTLPGANRRSLNIEIAGYARQTAEDWADEFSINALEIAALCAAEWCLKFSIPVRFLSDDEIRAEEKGFAGHVDVNRVYKQSTHWDPGPNFPWAYFLGRVRAQLGQLGVADVGPVSVVPTPNWNNRGYSTAWISSQQTKLNALGYILDVDGKLGSQSMVAVSDFQVKHGLDVDGIPGRNTSAALDSEIAARNTSHTRPNCVSLQVAVHTGADNAWGGDTDKHCDALRAASNWGGNKFPFGVAFTQETVGTNPDGAWGKNSRSAHDVATANVQRALLSMGFDPQGIDGTWGDNSESAYQAARRACHI